MGIKLSRYLHHQTNTPQLIEAARFGDKHAYEELISQCYTPVLRFCQVIGSYNDAQDLAQETFLRIMKCKIDSKEIINLEAFAIYIARLVCTDFIQQKKKIKAIAPSRTVSPVQVTSFVDEDNVYYEEILCILNDELRESFTLTQLLGFSYEQSASIVKVPIGTIRSRVSRARKQLQEHVKQTQAVQP